VSARLGVLAARGERGAYAILFAFAIVVLLGFGALAIDMTIIRLAELEAQDIADAAAQAAVYRLRRTGDVANARAAAELLVAQNEVIGEVPTLDGVTFGQWDYRSVPPAFTATETSPNAVRVTVSRAGEHAIQLFLAGIFGLTEADVRRSATAATQALHIVLVMDITGSWNQTNFRNARDASIAFLDVFENAYGQHDMFGMSIFTGRYALEYTPMSYIRDEVTSHTARSNWLLLNVASKGGTGRVFPQECSLKSDTSPTTKNAARNVFTSPTGGCYPAMPREYTDEPGTDHTVGITLARTMFLEQSDPTAFRAMVVLTDGIPNGLSATNGVFRTQLGYNEVRWRELIGAVPHTTTQIKTESNTLTTNMYDADGVNTWVISFVQTGPFMQTMPKGVGYYTNTASSAALIPIFEDIANSLPVALVE
jgi:Mg-chelatase subunit ChlD